MTQHRKWHEGEAQAKQYMDLIRYRVESEAVRARAEKLTETISELRRDLRDKDREIADLTQPPADSVTLDQLAEIGEAAAHASTNVPHAISQVFALAFTAAILRAARPEVDVTPEQALAACHEERPLLDWLNARIRYRVADLPDPDADVKYQPEQEPDSDLRQRQRECYDAVYVANMVTDNAADWKQISDYCHEAALTAARTLPERLAELDAAIGKEEG